LSSHGSRTRAEAERAAETAIAMLRRDASRSFPDAGVIRKIAENLCEALEALEIPLKGCGDRRSMTARELQSALDWLAHALTFVLELWWVCAGERPRATPQ
jgi:hypothetical protein